MNDTFEQEIRYRLLNILSNNSNLTQREMAQEMGISLGKLNYCISELAKKGFLKINRFKDSSNKLKYVYFLTPRGLEEKSRVTLGFLRRKISEYEEIKRQIRHLAREVGNDRSLEDTGAEAFEVATSEY
jgi:EPS-associated MarR family transcriptional regulator